jgi:hypothetical protein
MEPESPWIPETPQTRVSYHKLIQAFVRPHLADLRELVLAEPPLSVEERKTTHVVAIATSRTGDNLLRLRFPLEREVLFHLEVQLDGDRDMPRRAAQHIAHELETLEEADREGLVPLFVVLYLDKALYKDDPGYFELKGAARLRFFARHDVVKLWEIPAEKVLSMESPGFCPFAPLMAGKPEDLVLGSAEKIRSAPEELATTGDKALLLEALEAMARRVIMNKELLDAGLSTPGLLVERGYS